MFLRNARTRARQRATDPTIDPAVGVACRATPSLLEEVAIDAADFADLARVLKVDLATVVATLAATHATTLDALVEHLRDAAANGPLATSSDAPVAANEALASVRALGSAVAARLGNAAGMLTSIGGRALTTSWGGEDGSGWGRWTRTRGGARVHRSGSDHSAGPTASAAAASS